MGRREGSRNWEKAVRTFREEKEETVGYGKVLVGTLLGGNCNVTSCISSRLGTLQAFFDCTDKWLF